MLIEKRQLPEIINTELKTQLKIEGKQYKDIECNEKNYLGFNVNSETNGAPWRQIEMFWCSLDHRVRGQS